MYLKVKQVKKYKNKRVFKNQVINQIYILNMADCSRPKKALHFPTFHGQNQLLDLYWP